MDYSIFKDSCMLRLDPGDEIVASLRKLADEEGIALASVSGIGAIDHAVLGLFDPRAKQYFSKTLDFDMEIVSLVGSISTMNNESYIHVHMAAADADQRMYGGHLTEARVSVTAEIIITGLKGSVDRVFDEDIGINMIIF